MYGREQSIDQQNNDRQRHDSQIHEEEAPSRRSLWLRLRRELWVVPAATLIGALLAAAIYMGIWLGLSGQRQYRQTSKFYLTFGNDAAGNPQDYYNDYTWNDLLFSVPAIYQVIESELPEGVTLESAREDVEAQILSDVRLLTIQVTDPDAETVQALTNAVQDALVRYGSNAKEFQRIEFLSSDEVQPVVVTDRTQGAVELGALLGFLAGAAALWLKELLNDGICTPEEATRRYGLPVLMTLGALPSERIRRTRERTRRICIRRAGSKEIDAEAGDVGGAGTFAGAAAGNGLPEFLERENRAFAERQILLRSDRKEEEGADLQLVGDEGETVRQAARQLLEQYGLQAEVLSPADCLAEKPAEGRSIAVVIPFGRANGTGTEHLLLQLQARGYSIEGLLLAAADLRFLKSYYGREGTADRAAH